MEIQKYCVFLPFTLFNVALYCSKNDLCSGSLNLFFMLHFSLKVLSILRLFQFAFSLWIEFFPGQSEGFYCLFVWFSLIISFFKMITETQMWEKWRKSMYVLVLATRYSCFYFSTHTLQITLTRDRQADVGHAWLSASASTCFSSLPAPLQLHLNICKYLLHISPVN